MILCVIPARGGSKGLPKKNIKPLLGRPIIVYTIEAAKQENILDRVVVSTEDAEIAEVSTKHGIEVISRPKELAGDNSNIDGALKHAVEAIESDGNWVDIVVWLKANVPIRREGDIEKVIKKLIESDADSVFTLSEVAWPIETAYKLENEMIAPYCGKPIMFPNRQDYPKAYISNGAVYAIRRTSLMKEQRPNEPADYFLGQKKIGVVLSQFEYGLEIDDEKDFLICELFMKRLRNAQKDRSAS